MEDFRMIWKSIISYKKIKKKVQNTSTVNAIYVNKEANYVPLYK